MTYQDWKKYNSHPKDSHPSALGGASFKSPLKPHEHHSNIIQRSFKGPSTGPLLCHCTFPQSMAVNECSTYGFLDDRGIAEAGLLRLPPFPGVGVVVEGEPLLGQLLLLQLP